jgi:hypothetical protein
VPGCAGSSQSKVTLATGETCKLYVRFSVTPDEDRLAKLTLIADP